MSELETRVIDTFDELVAWLPEFFRQEWLARLENDAKEAHDIFSRPFDLEARYQFLVKVDSYFGGQDTLNDFSEAKGGKFTDIRNQFHYSRWELLRDYWRGLGRPSYDHATFTPYARGSLVRIVSGAVTYFSLDGTAYLPPSMKWGEILHGKTPGPTVADIHAATWKIWSVHGPDITNMPIYFCGSGICAGRSRSIFIRHEALRLHKTV